MRDFTLISLHTTHQFRFPSLNIRLMFFKIFFHCGYDTKNETRSINRWMLILTMFLDRRTNFLSFA